MLLLFLPAIAKAQAYPTGEKRFPTAAILNVKEVYGAMGDSQTDDTDAIRRAISDNVGKDRTLYFPNGNYLVSQPLEWKNGEGNWRARLTIQGQSQAGTVIRLKDHSPGFADASAPKPLIATGSNRVNNQESKDGSGNNAFNNLFYDLTIHTGSGNPGTVALDFVGTNMAGLRNVTIRSGDEQGIVGILLKREGAGPCLFKNITIEGFDYGIDVYGSQYSQTYEFITLKNQKKAAIRNTGNVLSLRKVQSENTRAVPVVVNANRDDKAIPGNSGNYGLITLIDASFVTTGQATSVSAILNEEGFNNRKGGLYVRNVTTKGYANAIQNRKMKIPGTRIVEFISDPVVGGAGKSASFALPVEETPDHHQNDLTHWASVTDYGASSEDPYGDDSRGIQAAIDSGKEIIFFPKGKYWYNINTTLVIRGNVRQLIGMQSNIDIGENTQFKDTTQPRPLFRFEPGKHDTVYFDRFTIGNQRKSPFDGGIFLEHASPQTLVLRDVSTDVYAKGKYFYRNTAKAGKLFIENVTSITPWHFAYAQQVWARQLNPESHHVPVGQPIISQNQGSLWVLGLKTEGPRTVLASTNGQAEILGGFLFPVKTVVSKSLPAFLGNNARMKLTYVINAYQATANYTVMVKDGNLRKPATYRTQLGNRGSGSVSPLCIIAPLQKSKH